MEKDSGTRSGLLWEVERILDECKELGNLPTILLLENVPEVVGSNNVEHFKLWRYKLEQLGYSNYDKILNAKDYGIPQNRRRCFMVSILGEYNYSFPKELPLKLKLKDMLEDNVDEKYYLSQKMIEYISNNNEKWTGNNNQSLIKKSIASTLNTGEGSKRCDASNYIFKELPNNYDLKSINKALAETLELNDLEEYQFIDSYNRNIRKDNCSGTITTRIDASNNTFIAIPTVKRVGELFDKDGKTHQAGSVYENPLKDIKPDRVCSTITTHCGKDSNGMQLVEEESLKQELCNKLIEDNLVEEGDIVKHSYTQQILDGNKKCVEKSDGIMITLTTRGDCVGVVVKDTQNYIEWQQEGYLDIDCRAYYVNGIAPTTTTPHSKVLLNNLRIRKLTPRECGRLMGVSDDDITKMAQNQSDASLYHLAGDSIVVNVLMAIFRNLF